MTLRCALFGQPVAHSPSPEMHRLFSEATACDLIYETREVPAGELAAALGQFVKDGGSGANVTLPLKEEAYSVCEHLSGRAHACAAVNTLLWRDEVWHGDNTDGVGFLRDLTVNHEIPVTGTRVLVAGAGGAARGIVGALVEHDPARLMVANRTLSRARTLAESFAPVAFSAYDALAGQPPFDLIVNATSLGHAGQAPPLPDGILSPGGCCYDLSYGPLAEPFLRWARLQGAVHMFDGVGMLVEQGAESFRLWTGKRPETPQVIAAMQKALG